LVAQGSFNTVAHKVLRRSGGIYGSGNRIVNVEMFNVE
jgi:hypothetical protein